MSVLACDRKGCENVMCDRLSHEYGYICNECFNKLVKLGPDTNIKEFMGQDDRRVFKIEDSYKYFDDIFPDVGVRL